MKPLRNNIIVTRIPAEKISAAGLILRTTNEPDRARIEVLGPLVDEVSIGDEVLLNWNQAVKVEGETYITSIDEVVFIYG